MPLVDAKCKSCGADLKIDSERKTAYCSYCGTQFIVEQAIEYYNVQNNVYARNVNITAKGEAEKERLLENAKTYLELFEYGKAEKIYTQIVEDYPADHRGWYGLASILSREFTKADCEPDEYSKIDLYLSRAIRFADPESKEAIEADRARFASLHKDFLSKKKTEAASLDTKAGDLEARIADAATRLETESKKMDELNKKKNRLAKKNSGGWLAAGMLGMISIVGLIADYSEGIKRLYAFIGVIGLLFLLYSVLRSAKKKSVNEKHKKQQEVCIALSEKLADMRRQLEETVKKAGIIRGVYKLGK